jgi:hypothetical protein
MARNGRSVIEEDITGISKNMTSISVGMKRKPARYGSIILCDIF